MAENSKIEWCHHTFNPWIGCTKVGPGCDHCYAEADFDKRRHVVQWGAGQPRKRTAPSTWALPQKWNARAERLGVRYRVFCASLADVFDNEVPAEWRADLFDLIAKTPNLDWLLVTKRVGNVERMVMDALRTMFIRTNQEPPTWPWANVWLGITVVNQAEADRDIPKLLSTPAAVRFLSMEPLLGPVDIKKWLDPYTCADCGFHGSDHESGPDGCSRCGQSDAFSEGRDECKSCGADDQSASRSCPSCGSHRSYERDMGFLWSSERRLIDWVIVGGESGPNARPMHPDWARSLRDQCAAAGVPFLFKQWGEWVSADCIDLATQSRVWRDSSYIEMESQGLIRRYTAKPPGPPHFACDHWLKAGKKAAGRLLDGVQHDGYPEVPHA